jgi:hypothetical protein
MEWALVSCRSVRDAYRLLVTATPAIWWLDLSCNRNVAVRLGLPSFEALVSTP